MSKQKGGCAVLDDIIVPIGLVVAQKKLKDAMNDGFSITNSITSLTSKVVDGSIFDAFLDAVSVNKPLKSNKKTKKNRKNKNKGTRKNRVF